MIDTRGLDKVKKTDIVYIVSATTKYKASVLRVTKHCIEVMFLEKINGKIWLRKFSKKDGREVGNKNGPFAIYAIQDNKQ